MFQFSNISLLVEFYQWITLSTQVPSWIIKKKDKTKKECTTFTFIRNFHNYCKHTTKFLELWFYIHKKNSWLLKACMIVPLITATLGSFVESAAVDFEYYNWSANKTILYPLIKEQQGCYHSCRFQSWSHLGHGRIADQRRLHFPLLCFSRTLSSFAAVYSPLPPYFHTRNNAQMVPFSSIHDIWYEMSD